MVAQNSQARKKTKTFPAQKVQQRSLAFKRVAVLKAEVFKYDICLVIILKTPWATCCSDESSHKCNTNRSYTVLTSIPIVNRGPVILELKSFECRPVKTYNWGTTYLMSALQSTDCIWIIL